MKKLLIILFTLLVLVGCSAGAKQEEVAIQEKPEAVAGGWTINEDLAAIEGDVYFSKAMSKFTGNELTPLFVLGETGSDPNKFAYLCYGKLVTANPTTKFNVAIVGAGDNSEDVSFINVADFNLNDYLDGEGSTTPEGVMGGFKDNGDLPNVLHTKTTDMFNQAVSSSDTKLALTPVCLLGTQVVAGTNYAFLSLGRAISDNSWHLYVVKIYEDLEGKPTISNICGIDLGTFDK